MTGFTTPSTVSISFVLLRTKNDFFEDQYEYIFIQSLRNLFQHFVTFEITLTVVFTTLSSKEVGKIKMSFCRSLSTRHPRVRLKKRITSGCE